MYKLFWAGRESPYSPARQDQHNINRTKSAKLVANEQKIGRICKHVVGKTVKWACTMEDGVPCLSFSAHIPHKYRWYGQTILPKISVLSCRVASWVP